MHLKATQTVVAGEDLNGLLVTNLKNVGYIVQDGAHSSFKANGQHGRPL